MSDELRQKLDDAVQVQEKLAVYVKGMTWKQERTADSEFQTALCQGMLALCEQTQVILEMVRAYGTYLREIHRHMQSMDEKTK